MKNLSLSKVYQLFEPDPVVLLASARKGRAHVITMSKHVMEEVIPNGIERRPRASGATGA
jgi:hypothetical protein